ncbi:MAG: C1 family peptidase [Agriterribacter sp.]
MAKKTNESAFKFGWVPDLPDQRDLIFSGALKTMQHLPLKVDLRKNCPPILTQGDLGSCTANSLGSAFQFGQMKQAIPNFIPSRLFLYYNERAMEGTIPVDSGAQIRDGIKSLNKQGVCAETNWTYDDDTQSPNAKFAQKPPKVCYDKALTNQILNYQRLNNASLIQLKACLSEGYPFVFGFTAYVSFFKIKKNGVMPMPLPNEKVAGGHAVMAVGYDEKKQVFIVQNSWGKSWGDKGYFYMPYAYITDTHLSDDFWTIRLVEKGVKLKRE